MAAKAREGLQDVVRCVRRRLSSAMLWRIQVEGFDRLPPTGRAILCPNHIWFLDSAFLMLTVPRSISFVGKAEYMDSWKTKYLFPALGMIPIDRGGGRRSRARARRGRARAAPRRAVRHLPRGHAQPRRLAVQGPHRRGPAGAEASAARSSPSASIGTGEIQPPDAKVPKLFGSCAIRIGRPIDLERYRNREPTTSSCCAQITDEVMYEIRELTGQEYVDVYATKKAETLPDRGGPASRHVRRTSRAEPRPGRRATAERAIEPGRASRGRR